MAQKRLRSESLSAQLIRHGQRPERVKIVTDRIKSEPDSVSITADYTIEGKTNIIADSSSGNVTVILPDVLDSKDRLIRIKKTVAANNVVIDGYSSNTIDGATTKTMPSQYDCMVLLCDGTQWNIISHYEP